MEEVGTAIKGITNTAFCITNLYYWIDVKVGQRVHVSGTGTWSEYKLVDTTTETLVPLPDSLTYPLYLLTSPILLIVCNDVEAAQLTVNPLTALALLDDLRYTDIYCTI